MRLKEPTELHIAPKPCCCLVVIKSVQQLVLLLLRVVLRVAQMQRKAALASVDGRLKAQRPAQAPLCIRQGRAGVAWKGRH